MFVAVVFKYQNDTHPNSHRDTGGWEAFLDYTKEGAAEKATLWANRWQLTPKQGENGKAKYYGPYKILVGELTEAAKPTVVTLAPVDDEQDLGGWDGWAY